MEGSHPPGKPGFTVAMRKPLTAWSILPFDENGRRYEGIVNGDGLDPDPAAM